MCEGLRDGATDSNMPSSNAPNSMLDGFSPREREIIRELLDAHSVKEIAGELNISVNTVKDYLKTVYQKAQVHSARELLIKLYMENDAPEMQDPAQGADPLLNSLQRVLDAGCAAEVVECLQTSIRQCTRGRKLSLWKVMRAQGELLLAAYPGEEVRIFLDGEFLRSILERGYSRMTVEELQRSFERRRLEVLGVRSEVVGLRLPLLQRLHVILVSDPEGGRFASSDLAVLRVFARLAEGAGQQRHPLGMGAIA